MGWFAVARTLPLLLLVAQLATGGPPPHRILVDTDIDTDDLFAILYLLKHDRAEFDVKVTTTARFLACFASIAPMAAAAACLPARLGSPVRP